MFYLQVIDVKKSSINMVPSKVEIILHKADQVAWGKLEDPNYKPEPEPVEDSAETNESYQPIWDIDNISDLDEEWAYDIPKIKRRGRTEMSRKRKVKMYRGRTWRRR